VCGDNAITNRSKPAIRFERRLCEEVDLYLAHRWFCRLDLDDTVPDHSTLSVKGHGLCVAKTSSGDDCGFAR
jgi:hypothetical protein